MGLHAVVKDPLYLVHPVVQALVLLGVELREPIAGYIHFAVPIGEIVGGGQLVHIFKEGLRPRGILEAEIALQRPAVELLLKGRMGQETLYLRAEHEGPAHLCVVQRLYAEEVPGPEELAPLPVPEGKGEHPPYPVQNPRAVLLIAVQNNLGVGLCPKLMPGLYELPPYIPVVVYLAVKDQGL